MEAIHTAIAGTDGRAGDPNGTGDPNGAGLHSRAKPPPAEPPVPTCASSAAAVRNFSSAEPPVPTCASSAVRNFSSAEPPVPTCASSASSAVRNFSSAVPLYRGGPLSAGHSPLVPARQPYGRAEERMKSDPSPWGDYGNVPGTLKDAAVESSQGTSAKPPPPPPPGACKFIKDEKEPAVAALDGHCPGFDLASGMPGLEPCYDAEPLPQLGFGDDSTGFTCAQSSPNFPADPNRADQLAGAPPYARTDPRCALSGKAAVGFDAMSGPHAAQQMLPHKVEPSRWSIQSSNADPQIWCQPAGVPEDPFTRGAYDALQSSALAQRSPLAFSVFPGMPPQRLCVICGDEASGCHYGVLTCGSCKVFFKRAVEGHHNYLCAGRNDCIVDKIRRKNCPACRLRKCYQAGMMLGGRKLKRFGALKALGMASSLMFQSHLAMSGDSQALTSAACMSGIREMQFSPQIINILENIEPETVYSGYDNIQPDVPHILLNSLNRLCEQQLLWIVRWSKCLPGFRSLHINDQMTLIQFSWMNLMVFALGWRSFQNVSSEYLYFAPDLVLSQEEMRRSPIYDLCLAMQFIPQELTNLQVTREEFLCMKAIIILNTVPLEGLKSQAAFDEMRQNYIRELTKVIHIKEKGVVASSQRFYHLTKLMDSIHEIVKKVSLYCLSTFIQADAMKVEFPGMMSEVIASQLPKILAGMVKPLLFHSK
ncbi:progesterone receptor [Lampris incognitus]|uniref:progesterone receptor n=1 Tax=Lampris incognitus TaxID=2546036 RepID=UPI0024B555AC|nr:progesterone receptor [Lampris incognitus]